MINWLRGLFCKEKEHIPIVRYVGMSVFGYVCRSCGHEWYEDKKNGFARELEKMIDNFERIGGKQ